MKTLVYVIIGIIVIVGIGQISKMAAAGNNTTTTTKDTDSKETGGIGGLLTSLVGLNLFGK